MASLPWRVVWITGASTGIGRQLAAQLAKAGVIVAASARSAEKLKDIAPGVYAYPVDVTDAGAMRLAFESITRDHGPVDLAVCAAGTYRPLDAANFDIANFTGSMAVNYHGVIHALASLLPAMLARREGHVAWVASVAGFRGLPKAAAYGPTKAALINLAESLKPELERDGVIVSVINPGFVATPLTAQNEFPMPFLMQPDEAARRIIAGLLRRRFEIAFPRRFVAIIKLGRIMPNALYFWIVRKFILKP